MSDPKPQPYSREAMQRLWDIITEMTGRPLQGFLLCMIDEKGAPGLTGVRIDNNGVAQALKRDELEQAFMTLALDLAQEGEGGGGASD